VLIFLGILGEVAYDTYTESNGFLPQYCLYLLDWSLGKYMYSYLLAGFQGLLIMPPRHAQYFKISDVVVSVSC
jgi:hypothetical protein